MARGTDYRLSCPGRWLIPGCPISGVPVSHRHRYAETSSLKPVARFFHYHQRKETAEMSKHTPGPWEQDTENQGAEWQSSFIVCGEHTIICDMVDGDDDERRANAHLIAAAPEMLAVLKMIQSKASSSIGLAVVQGADMEKVWAAIAKAKGWDE